MFKKAMILLTAVCLLTGCHSAAQTPGSPAEDGVVLSQTALISPGTPSKSPNTTVQTPSKPVVPQETEPVKDLTASFYLPLLQTIGDAKYDRVAADGSGYANIIYNNGSLEALREYLFYCAACGLYSREVTLSNGLTVYYLHPMGVPYKGAVYLDPETSQLIINTEIIENMLEADELEAHMAYYDQELSFPASFGKNVFPQFYASINAPRPQVGRSGSEVDYVFDGGKFWNEMYWDVSYTAVRKYLDEMLLCGFETWVVTGDMDDNGALQTTVLQLSNGDADIVLTYDAADGDVSIYYESGTMWTLLDGENYTRYIPQR